MLPRLLQYGTILPQVVSIGVLPARHEHAGGTREIAITWTPTGSRAAGRVGLVTRPLAGRKPPSAGEIAPRASPTAGECLARRGRVAAAGGGSGRLRLSGHARSPRIRAVRPTPTPTPRARDREIYVSRYRSGRPHARIPGTACAPEPAYRPWLLRESPMDAGRVDSALYPSYLRSCDRVAALGRSSAGRWGGQASGAGAFTNSRRQAGYLCHLRLRPVLRVGARGRRWHRSPSSRSTAVLKAIRRGRRMARSRSRPLLTSGCASGHSSTSPRCTLGH